jgi:hypothetical protein
MLFNTSKKNIRIFKSKHCLVNLQTTEVDVGEFEITLHSAAKVVEQ